MQLLNQRCLKPCSLQAVGKLSLRSAARPHAALLLHSVGLQPSAGSRHPGRLVGASFACRATLTKPEAPSVLEKGAHKRSLEITEAVVEAVIEGGHGRYMLKLPDGRMGELTRGKTSLYARAKQPSLELGGTVCCEITSHEPLRFSMLELELFPGEMRTDKAAVFDRARQYASWKLQRGGDGTFHEFLGQTMLPQFLAPRIVPEQKPELTNRMSAYDEVRSGQLLEAKVVKVTSSLVSMYVPSLDVYGRLHISQVSQSFTTTYQLLSTFTPGAKVLVTVAKVERHSPPGVQPHIFFSTRDLEAEPGLVHKSLAEYNKKAPAVYMQHRSQWLSGLMDEAEQSFERYLLLPSMERAKGRLFKCTVLEVKTTIQTEEVDVQGLRLGGGLLPGLQMSQKRVESVAEHFTVGSELVMKLKKAYIDFGRQYVCKMNISDLEAEPGEFLNAREAMMARLRQAWEEQPPLPTAGVVFSDWIGVDIFSKQCDAVASALLRVPAFRMLGAARHTPEAQQALRRYIELLERFVAVYAHWLPLYQAQGKPLPASGAPGLRIKLQALRACQMQAGEWVSSQDTDLEQSLLSTREAFGEALAALTNNSIPDTNCENASDQVLKGLSDALLCLRVADQTLHQQAVQAWLVACTPQIVQLLRSDISNISTSYRSDNSNISTSYRSDTMGGVRVEIRLIQLLANNGWFAAYRQTDPVASQGLLQVLFDRLLKRLLLGRPNDVPPEDAHASPVLTSLYNIKALLSLARVVGYQPTDTWWGLLFQEVARIAPEIINATELGEKESMQLSDIKTLAFRVCGARMPTAV